MEDKQLSLVLQLPARALAAVPAADGCSQWIVGTNGVREENEVHLVECDAEGTAVRDAMTWVHPHEIWDVASCPADSALLMTAHNNAGSYGATLWHGASGSSGKLLEERAKLPDLEGRVHRVLFHPLERARAVALTDTGIHAIDLAEASAEGAAAAALPAGGQAFRNIAVSSMEGSAIATASGEGVATWDERALGDGPTCARLGSAGHATGAGARTVAWSPTAKHVLASAGDEGSLRLWDLRSPETPLSEMHGHSHWVWQVSFNPQHPQLLLSASSDCLVGLWDASRASAAASGRPPASAPTSDAPERDGLIASVDVHDDSVYGAAWCARDPWRWASLSYDGRVVIGAVPQKTQYRILI